MMNSHLVTLLVFSFLVSTVFAFLQKETPAERLRFFAWCFAAFVLTTIAIGWLTRWIPT
jgi:hypothetical protein